MFVAIRHRPHSHILIGAAAFIVPWPRPQSPHLFVHRDPGFAHLAVSSATARLLRAGMAIRGEPACGRDQSRHNLVSGRSKDPNHDAVMRIGSEAPKRRTHSSSRHESQGACRDSATSNRHRRPITSGRTMPKLSGCLSTSSVHCAGRKTTPSGTTPCRTSRHRAIRSLRAKATIMGFRVPRAFSVRARNHSVKALSFWCKRNRHAN